MCKVCTLSYDICNECGSKENLRTWLDFHNFIFCEACVKTLTAEYALSYINGYSFYGPQNWWANRKNEM